MGGSKLTQKDYIKRLKEVGSTLEPLEPYINSKTKIKHICSECESIKTYPPQGAMKGQKCGICNPTIGCKTKSLPDFKRALLKYGNRFKLLDKSFKGSRKLVVYKDLKCGHTVVRRASKLLETDYCPKCSSNWGRTAFLYVLTLRNNLYKIGITFYEDLRYRYNNSDLDLIEQVEMYKFHNKREAFKVEQRVIKNYKRHLYKGDNIFSYTGNTEVLKVKPDISKYLDQDIPQKY